MLVKKGFSLIEVLIVIVLISILGSAGYLLWQNKSGPAPTSIPIFQPTNTFPTLTSTITPLPLLTLPDGTISQSFNSPNNILKFTFYTTNNVEFEDLDCKYQITDISGNSIQSKYIDETIRCYNAMGGLASNVFRGWVNDNQFLIEKVKGTLIAYGVNSDDEYRYDFNKYRFLKVNQTLNKWLMENLEETPNATIFSVFTDFNSNPTEITFSKDIYGDQFLSFYDQINHNFFTIWRIFNPNDTAVTVFTTIDETTLTINEIARSKPLQARGMGCQFGEVTFSEGEITINNLSCLYISEDMGAIDGKLTLDL